MICSGRSTELSLHFKYRERLHYECRPGKAGKTRQLTKMGRPVRRKSLASEHPGDALKGRSVVADGSIFHEAPSRKFHGRVTGTRGCLPALAPDERKLLLCAGRQVKSLYTRRAAFQNEEGPCARHV